MSSSTVRFLQQENIRLQSQVQELEQENRELKHQFVLIGHLHEAIQNISHAEAPAEIISQLLHQVIAAIGATDGSISRLLSEESRLVFVLVAGELQETLPGYHIASDTGIAGWVVANKQPIIVNTPNQDWRFSHAIDDEFGFLTRSIISAPILDETKLVGVIQLLNKKNNNFTDIDLVLISMLCNVVALVLGQLPVPEPVPPPDITLL
jgi:GAF domain-containing protein